MRVKTHKDLTDHTVPKVIDIPQYNMKCSGDNVILHGIFHVVSGFPLHFMYSNIAEIWIVNQGQNTETKFR